MEQKPTKIKLEIKADDIKNSSYYNTSDCAITRALARAGYPNLRDKGMYIRDQHYKKVEMVDPQVYNCLSKTVRDMYAAEGKLIQKESPFKEAEDFEQEIELFI